MSREPLARVTSIKVKLGLLVAASVTVAAAFAALGDGAGVPLLLVLPVTVALALGVTQLLAVGMTSPLREMTHAARGMARGDYSARAATTSRDEIGELAAAFNQMAHDLGTVDQERRDLVATVSHELRTPLAALTARLENLADGVEPPDPATLDAVTEQSRRLGALVADLLDLSRLEAGQASLLPEPVGVRDLLEATVADHGTIPGGRDVRYVVEVCPEDLTVAADPRRLRQLVTNLTANAVRHSPTGGLVSLAAAEAGADRWRLTVRDQGPGVAPADRERVFERFGTLAGQEGGGTGLGLAIARRVTSLHGGEIRFVDPPPGDAGACVQVDLPRSPRPRRLPTPSTPEPHLGSRTGAAAPGTTPGAADRAGPLPALPPLLAEVSGGFWPEAGLTPRRGLLLGSAAVGALAGAVLPGRVPGLGLGLVLAGAALVVLLAAGRLRPYAASCAALAAALGSVVVLRDAAWIWVLCLLAAGAVMCAGLTGARTVLGFVVSALAWPLSGIRGLPWLARTLDSLTGLARSAAVLRTVLLGTLGLVVFGALFASADAVFAQWVDTLLPDTDVSEVVSRGFLTVAVGGAVLAAAYLALNPPRAEREPGASRPVQSRFEWLAPVLLVDLVLAVFLAAQATAVFGGHRYIAEATGLTYAEYVHQGFAQLTVATSLTLLVVWAAARKAPRRTAADRRWLRAALGALGLLTLVVVASALYRLQVYQEAYGFTRLRLLVGAFEGWLGLVVVAVLVAGASLRGWWLPRFALLSGAAALLGLALVNPDAWIARHNIDRFAGAERMDWSYLGGLSADAVPELLEATPPGGSPVCLPSGWVEDMEEQPDDWLSWNLGRARAEAAVRDAGVDPSSAPCDPSG